MDMSPISCLPYECSSKANSSMFLSVFSVIFEENFAFRCMCL